MCRYGNQHCWRCNHREPYVGGLDIIQERSTWIYDRVDIWAVSESLIKQEIMAHAVIIKQEEEEEEDQKIKSDPNVGAGRDEASVLQEYDIPAVEDLEYTIDNNNASQKYSSWETFPLFDKDQEMTDMTDTAFAIPDFMDDHEPRNTKGRVIRHNDKLTKDTWLGDTGASCQLTNDDSNMFDVQAVRAPDGKGLRNYFGDPAS
jgi:hypothetical protein